MHSVSSYMTRKIQVRSAGSYGVLCLRQQKKGRVVKKLSIIVK